MMFNPAPNTVLEIDDTLIAIGDNEALGSLGSRVS